MESQEMESSPGDRAGSWIPASCTLPAAQQPLRRAEFDAVFAEVQSVERPGPARLRLDLDSRPAVAARVAELAAAETQCCSFFTFVLTAADRRLTLEISVPSAQAGLLDALANHVTEIRGTVG